MKFSRLLTPLLLVIGLGMGGCSLQDDVDPHAIVFGNAPLQQMGKQKSAFQKIPKKDLQLLVAYLGANELARIKGQGYSVIEGKTVAQVFDEARQWIPAVERAMADGRAVAALILQSVDVQIKDRSVSTTTVQGAATEVLTVTYLVTNRSSRTVTGLMGRMTFQGPDNRPIAALNVVFRETIAPGQVLVSSGNASFRLGSQPNDPVRLIAESDKSGLQARFDPTTLVFENGDRLQVPLL